MPWHQVPTKDAASCDKPRGAASRRRSGDFRMGQPGAGNAASSIGESIAYGRAPGELKHLSTPRKRDSLSSGERKGRSPNHVHAKAFTRCGRGVVGPVSGEVKLIRGSRRSSRRRLERRDIEGKIPVGERLRAPLTGTQVPRGTLTPWESGRSTS